MSGRGHAMRDRRALSQWSEDIACVSFVSTCKFHAMSRLVVYSFSFPLFSFSLTFFPLRSVINVFQCDSVSTSKLVKSHVRKPRDTRYFVADREKNSLRTQITTCVAHGIQCACGLDVAANKLSSDSSRGSFLCVRNKRGNVWIFVWLCLVRILSREHTNVMIRNADNESEGSCTALIISSLSFVCSDLVLETV